MTKSTALVILVSTVISIGVYFFITKDSDKALEVQVNFDLEEGDSKVAQNEIVNEGGASIPVIKKAEILDLSGQGLTKAPAYIFERISAKELNLSSNVIEGSLQAEIRHLKELRTLNLSNNKFTGVPAEIGQLEKLEVLNLSNNRLTGLPMELGNIKNLTLLDLRGNAYNVQDLANIKKNLSNTTKVLVD